MFKFFVKAALVTAACVSMCFTSSNKAEAAWPEKTIRIILPYAAGGGSDLSARLFAKYLEKYLPVSVVVTNITGSAGLVAERETLNAAPDGYTFIWQHHKLHACYLTGVSDYSFREFTPLFTIMNNPFVFVQAKHVTEKNVQEIVASIKKNPGSRTYAFQPRSNTNFYYLDFCINAGLDPKNSFRPINNLIADDPRRLALLQGNLDYTMNNAASIIPYAQTGSGDLRILAVGGKQRMSILPDVPTLVEQGVNATLASPYHIALAPKGVPVAIQKTYHDAVQKVAVDKDFLKECAPLGINVELIHGDALWKHLEIEENAMRELAKQADILVAK